MSLELKHLAAYLPYNLSISDEYGNISILNCIDIEEIDGIELKPILYPKTHLRNLQNEILIRWGCGLPERAKVKWIKEMIDNMEYSAYVALRYDEVVFMLEHHIDVFNLISNNLAIDKNQIKW